MQGIFKRFAVLGVVLAFAIPAPVMAQDSVVGGYNETEITDPGDPANSADPADPADPAAESEGGSLPFTGLDVALLAVAGAGLVAVGFGMRRLTRRPDAA